MTNRGSNSQVKAGTVDIQGGIYDLDTGRVQWLGSWAALEAVRLVLQRKCDLSVGHLDNLGVASMPYLPMYCESVCTSPLPNLENQ